MNMRSDMLDIIIVAAQSINDQLAVRIPTELGADTPLFGVDGVLDSVGLVSLVLAAEEAIRDAVGVDVTLADERALSLSRSPFRTIGSLAEYAEQLVERVSVNE